MVMLQNRMLRQTYRRSPFFEGYKFCELTAKKGPEVPGSKCHESTLVANARSQTAFLRRGNIAFSIIASVKIVSGQL